AVGHSGDGVCRTRRQHRAKTLRHRDERAVRAADQGPLVIWYDPDMLKGFTHARLACGCRLAFREGVEGSPVAVVVDEKGVGCGISLHVRDLPVYDYREALRPPTRLLP